MAFRVEKKKIKIKKTEPKPTKPKQKTPQETQGSWRTFLTGLEGSHSSFSTKALTEEDGTLIYSLIEEGAT